MSKKILYIAIGAYQLVGVREKIKAKSKALVQVFDQFECLFFCNDIDAEFEESGVKFIPFKYEGNVPSFWAKPIIWKYLDFFYRREKFKIIQECVNQRQFDRIIFRYNSADWSLFKFVLKYFKRVYFEHNILELNELKLLPVNNTNKYFYRAEKFWGPIIRSMAKGLISVTEEIARHEQSRSLFPVRSELVSNGIALEQFPFVKVKRYTEGPLHVLFVGGFPNPAHGVDLLINSVLNSSGVILHLVGDFMPSNIVEDSRIQYYPKLEGDAYSHVYALCHVAVSPLAIYRKGLSEAVSLKNREYCARGIPFILGHVDPDFRGQNIQPFVHQVRIQEGEQLDFNAIKLFLQQIKHLEYSNMRTFAKEHLSYDAKAKAYQHVIK